MVHGINMRRVTSNHQHHRGGLVFDGMDAYVDVGRLGRFGGSLNSFSIALWVKTLDQHNARSAIMKVIDDQDQVLGIEVNRRVGNKDDTGQQGSDTLTLASGHVLVYLRDSRGRILAGSIRAPIFNNHWHHIQWSVIDSAKNDMV